MYQRRAPHHEKHKIVFIAYVEYVVVSFRCYLLGSDFKVNVRKGVCVCVCVCVCVRILVNSIEDKVMIIETSNLPQMFPMGRG